MNPRQFQDFAAKHYTNSVYYWPLYRDQLAGCFRSFVSRPGFSATEQDVATAMLLLLECETAFRNRINGTIQDDWIETKLVPIAPTLCLVLAQVKDKEDWQVQLEQRLANLAET